MIGWLVPVLRGLLSVLTSRLVQCFFVFYSLQIHRATPLLAPFCFPFPLKCKIFVSLADTYFLQVGLVYVINTSTLHGVIARGKCGEPKFNGKLVINY